MPIGAPLGYGISVLRRLFAILAACLALVATQSAWGVPLVCRAEAEVRACHCDHSKGAAVTEDDCCSRAEPDTMGQPGHTLPVPAFVRVRLPALPPAAAVPADVADLPSSTLAFLASIPARAPPAAPRFLALRSLLI